MHRIRDDFANKTWDEQPTPVPNPASAAGDANTLENRTMCMLRPKSWYGKLNLRKSISDTISSGAALWELTDAVGQDAAKQYIEDRRR